MTKARLLLRVAGEEAVRYFRAFNKRVLLFLLVGGAVGAALFPLLVERGVTPDERIYRAELVPGSPLEDALRADRRFEVFEGLGSRFPGSADLLVQGTNVFYADTERGRAAVNDFAASTERYFDERLASEANQTAAFPVRVNVVYQPRSLAAAQFATGGGGGASPTPGAFAPVNESSVLNQPGEAQLDLVPGTVEPPFPMRSLLLTFLYLIPLNFIGQYYAGSLLQERTRSRGLLLLSAPLTGPQILLGKALPYVALSLLVAVGVTVFLGAGALAFIAIVPVIGFYLAATSFMALVARSYRELTFFLTTMSVALSTFLFLPAIFTQVHPIAFISPVSVVAAQIRGEAVPLASVVYSVTPLTLAAVVLGFAAAAIYREEDLFAPRAVTSKVLDAIHGIARGPYGFLIAGVAALPFVFAAELFLLAFAVTLPLRAAIALFLVGVGAIEELAKALPSLAHYRRNTNPRPPWLAGAWIGCGFFLGEKVGLLLTVVGLDLLPLGRALLATYGVTASFLLIVAPLFLHVVTATISAYAARRGRWMFALGLLAAITLHVLYNRTVIGLAS